MQCKFTVDAINAPRTDGVGAVHSALLHPYTVGCADVVLMWRWNCVRSLLWCAM